MFLSFNIIASREKEIRVGVTKWAVERHIYI
jgi:hypothetical protein